MLLLKIGQRGRLRLERVACGAFRRKPELENLATYHWVPCSDRESYRRYWPLLRGQRGYPMARSLGVNSLRAVAMTEV